MSSLRLDMALVERGLSLSRSRAGDAVRRGCVRVNGRVVTKPGQAVSEDDAVECDDPGGAYVSRGALKLIAALDAFGFSPEGLACLDLGASTGGFTQILLERGAALVHAVDVGRDQLDDRLRNDARVKVREGLNARDLTPSALVPRPCALVADLSFVSLLTALPAPLACLQEPHWLAVLVKPQFEVGREGVGKGGLVRNPALAAASVARVSDWLTERGWSVRPAIPSPIAGGDGNTEYLLGAVPARRTARFSA